MFQVDEFPAAPWRRRLLALVIALGTAWAVMGGVMGRPGAANFKPPPPPDRAACKPGQTTDCVGGTASVIIAPVPGGASSAAR